MEFRIKSIFLIPKNNANPTRIIEFSLDKVNVITGGSEKGKSALIAIVDYCLCSNKCRIPTGKIRNYTEWFGLHLILDSGIEMIVARKEPGDHFTSGDMYISEAKNLSIPSALSSNINVAAVKKRFNNIADLTDIDINDTGYKKGFDSHPSFRDFTSFLFQPQYIIANQVSLFYRTDSMAHRQKLINIFNYILQAVDNQYLEFREEIKQIDRDLYDLTKELEKKQRNVNRIIGLLRGYYAQAKEFGLLSSEPYASEDWTAVDYVQKLKLVPAEVNSLNIIQTPLDAVANTSNRIAELTSSELNYAYELQNLKHRQELLNNLIESNIRYRDNLLKQHDRLKTSSWFNELLSKHEEECPFCQTKTTNGKTYINSLIAANNQIISKGTQLNDNGTVLRSEQRKVSAEIQSIIVKINEIRQELDVLRKSSETQNTQLNTLNTIYRFAGKIETEVGSFEASSDGQSILDRIDALEKRKDFILEQINNDVITNKVKRAKKKITDVISYYAGIFKAENHGELIQFNEKDLTLTFVSETGRTDALYEIGSGSNFMAYHLSTILAFHEFFLGREKHPSPNFVFLDQPTQVYFPETDQEILKNSEDVDRVRKIFEVLNSAIERTKGKLQIITLEHVGEYAWTGFANIVKIKRWRDDEPDKNDRALIPDSWLN